MAYNAFGLFLLFIGMAEVLILMKSPLAGGFLTALSALLLIYSVWRPPSRHR